ncbi:Type I Modular PKS [Purpureocillium takamizusanense]|uniref:Type I Modular PKS n=1 Tax=Purpureocillium takamizusanense TaxID=2060973 RepID=A0A9Q8QEY8_9HYPO|nr:Type I Modular PKS [Purpureocillium takamizusanense]UNI19584.1 Type I Modular PKS [Purpureocillium takamizusanense]
MMQATPASWQMLLDSGWRGTSSLKKILCGGEAMTEQLGTRLLACGGAVWNLYGPTEATVWASVWRVRPAEHVIIGKPLANYRLYVLDESLAPVPPGVSGDLYIGGAGLARGYHNKPELTRASFLDSGREDLRGRIYHTGDIACFSANGELRVLGRADNQVKVRGYRIELGDIEAAITSHPGVSGAVVVARKDQLFAYCIRCVGHNYETPSHQDKALGTAVTMDAMLRPWLAKYLPSYMMPAFFVELEAFPLTPNNKIDRKALPSPFAEQSLDASRESSFECGTGSVGELERRIVAIWARALDHGSISTKDNFFQVGGNSLRLIQVQAELEKLLSRPISTAKLLEHYTAEALAAYLVGGDMNSPVQIPSTGYGPAAATGEVDAIAIVSLACRLPGGVTTPEEFWKLLDAGGDAITDVPEDRWNATELYDPDPDVHGKTYCSQGGYLSSIDSFDISFFGISPREAQEMDPVQLLVLEMCWEGLERAGYPLEKLRGSRTGVYIGVSNMPAHQNYTRPLEDLNGYTATGSSGATLSGRVSYALGLEGPSMTVDTACSSSLVTTDLACAALRRGECDMAVSCGVTLMLTPGLHVEFSRLRGISRDGRCRAFSDDTNGTGWAEGSTAVVLRRLPDAQRDGDAIRAVVRGSAVNHGGRSASLTTPSGPAQQRLIRDALASSRLEPGDIDYIEAHGTGTKLGDPIEGEALAAVFGSHSGADRSPLWVGSAKSNIGHTQAAAGLVGVLKVVLALEHELIPRTLHISEPTRAVDWQGAGMALVQQERPWPRDERRLRRAGVSSFGIGGTNAHVVIEEAPVGVEALPSGASETELPPPLDSLPFLISGHTEEALRQQATKLWHFLGDDNIDQSRLGPLAYSLATTRTHFRHRLVLMAQSKAALRDQLAAAAVRQGVPSVHTRPLAMLFTGQGSQLPGMGRDLSQVYPVFRESLEVTAAHFTLERPLLDIMWADADNPDDVALLNRTDFAQAALFTLEVALLHLWRSWGVEPHVVLGHSLGEFVAAYAAGILDLSSACRLVEARGRLMQTLPRGGGMVSVEAHASEVAAMIDELGFNGMIDVASHNTPTQTVISGDIDITERMAAYVAGLGRKVKPLNVSHAFHSHHMDGMLAEFRAVVETIQFYPPRLAIVSSVTGQLAEPGELETPHYWVEQARRAVRFSDAIAAILDMDIGIFVELGPQPVLSGLGAACLISASKHRPCTWLPSLHGRKSGTLTIQGSVVALHALHVPVDWAAYFKPFGYVRVELPTYAFQRERVLSLSRSLPQGGQSDVNVGGNMNLKSESSMSLPLSGNTDLRISLRYAAPMQHDTIVQSVVREVVADTLGISSTDEVDIDRTWQDNGIDSVMEPQMRTRLAAATDMTLPANVTTEHPNLRAFSEYLLHLMRRDSVDSESTETGSSYFDSPTQGSAIFSETELSRTGELEDSLTFDNAVQHPGVPKSVFLTGGTDFVGAFLLQSLLELGITAHCLVRAENTGEVMERLEATLEGYSLWRPQYKPLVRPVVGDMTQPKFGLSAEAFRHLADNVDAICHFNTLADYSRRPWDDCIGPDVVSTREVLRLASQGSSKSIHFISTSATPSKHLDLDTCPDERQQSHVTSKSMAEHMVAEARLRGANASIYRLPLIFASSDTGIYEPGIEDVLHCLIVGSLETGRYPSLDADLSAVMPVDYLCTSLASIMVQQPRLMGCDVDFENPQALRFDDFFSMMGAGAHEG